MSSSKPVILRHRTAIRKPEISLPMKSALRDGLVATGATVFDYGCGHGEDIRLLNEQGIPCRGLDPAFFPDVQRGEADVVNLGYVVNVIESQEERDATLRSAWGLCRRALFVCAQILVAGRGSSQIEFGNGILMSRNTFQRYFRQDKLKNYIERVLEVEAVPAAMSVFYVSGTKRTASNYFRGDFAGESLPPGMIASPPATRPIVSFLARS